MLLSAEAVCRVGGSIAAGNGGPTGLSLAPAVIVGATRAAEKETAAAWRELALGCARMMDALRGVKEAAAVSVALEGRLVPGIADTDSGVSEAMPVAAASGVAAAVMTVEATTGLSSPASAGGASGFRACSVLPPACSVLPPTYSALPPECSVLPPSLEANAELLPPPRAAGLTLAANVGP